MLPQFRPSPDALLRVGLSAARGIALAAGKPVVGLTTLTAYAAPFVSENSPHPIISAIDARHDHGHELLLAETLEVVEHGPVEQRDEFRRRLAVTVLLAEHREHRLGHHHDEA